MKIPINMPFWKESGWSHKFQFKVEYRYPHHKLYLYIKDAVNFLKLGVSVEIVAQGTGLSIDIIRELKKEIMN